MADDGSILADRKDVAMSRRRVWVILLAILLLGGILRVAYFGKAPPGLNQDEAVNAWNAYCLLKTGKDMVGVSWPIFYMRGIGGYWSPLYIYLSIPFQAIGGLSIAMTRAPAVFFGIATIALIYYVGKRLFNDKVGLLAALLLAVNPWHFQQSRWGHESSIAALLGLTPLALMLWANIIPITNKAARPVAAGIAGIVSGVCCYGYQPVRVFVPVFLFLIVLLNIRQWLQELKKPKQLFAIIIFIIGFAAIFGPLAWQHIFHPEWINRHFLFQTERFGAVGPYESIRNSMVRYIQHFSPDFLFGPLDYISPPDKGLLDWYMAPLLLAGLIMIIIKSRKSISAMVILAFIAAYPVGDILVWEPPLSAFRSFAGSGGIILLAAMGGIYPIEWLWKRYKTPGYITAGVFAVIMVISSISYFHSFFGFCNNKNNEIRVKFNPDLVEACQWLKPRLGEYDAVIFSPIGVTHIIAVVTLEYDPNRWLSEPREFVTNDEWDSYTRFCKIYISLDAFSNADLKYRPGHILIIFRPGEIMLEGIENNIIHKIIGPDGTEALWLCVI
jgi:4-amino-4-deoxy-L-arabinose transferase-like glycosyltransferase